VNLASINLVSRDPAPAKDCNRDVVLSQIQMTRELNNTPFRPADAPLPNDLKQTCSHILVILFGI
jgi:hypothetical protein